MSLLKYAAKLRKMSPGELSFRARQKARNTLETMRWKRNGADGDLFVPEYIRRWDTEKYPFPATETRFFGLAEDKEFLQEEFRRLFPGAPEIIKKQADALLAHRFHFLGLDVELPDPIPWNRNPESGADYPRQHHAQMDAFNTERYGDVKFAWELNRHQFFIEVARAYLLTGEEKYAEKIWNWLQSWIADNPHKIGINNTSVLEHAVRIFSWIWAYYFTKDSPVWTAERLESLAKNLLLQGEMIEENLSYYYSPYNHLIGELAALAFLGTVYGNSPKLQTWRDKYWQEMEAQAEKQFHPDGFTVEQASYYHHFTLGFYLMLALLRKQNGLPVSPRVWQTLERAIEFPMHLTRPDGQLPMLGDIDSARSIYFYHPHPKWDLRPFQALGAVIFRRGDMKFIAGDFCEEILWLLGSEGLESFQQLQAEKPQHTSCDFPNSGYFILRDGWEKNSNYCCFDCGEIAHGVFKDETPSAAHGHGDILSFELCADGQPLIIDPGFHTYFGPLEWHRYFRSTRGHNAIEVNGAGQAVHEGRIGWSQVSSPLPECRISTPQFELAGAAIDRFAKLPEKFFHRRYILFNKGKYFLIMDEVGAGDCGKTCRMESSFHFAPGELVCEDSQLFYNGKLAGLFAVPGTAGARVAKGGEGPGQGWIARGYGEKEPAPVLRINLEQRTPVRLGIVFPLGAARDDLRGFEMGEAGKDITVFNIRFANAEEKIYWNPLRRKFSLPDASLPETDAPVVLETRRPGAESEFCYLESIR